MTEEIKDVEEAWFYPSLRVIFDSSYFKFFSEKHMSTQNLDAILQRLDPTITSSFFRYFATEKYLTLGYSERELMLVGDWSSIQMPSIYAKRAGLSQSERRFSEDSR